MKVTDAPSAENLPAYKSPPISGNLINGQGEKEIRKANRVFHALEHPNFDWAAMNAFFLMNSPFKILVEALTIRWKLRRSAGPIAKQQKEVKDIDKMAEPQYK